MHKKVLIVLPAIRAVKHASSILISALLAILAIALTAQPALADIRYLSC